MAKIIYTHTDEAPLLATYSFLPIIAAYAKTAGVDVETRDISLAGRVIAQFPDRLTDEQRLDDALAELGELATKPEANIIKLPNISASIPQLKATIAELQSQGYDLPDYPENPQTDEERETRARYDKVKGSAVNPVLREGNSDRRAPASVKNYAKAHPHSMGAWSSDSKTSVATMGHDDFRSNEKSVVLAADDTLSIVHVGADGKETVLKEGLKVLEGEVVDATFMSAAALDEFLERAGRQGQGRRRAVLRPPQGHDDEGLRPDHLRPRRARLLRRRLRPVRRAARRGRPVGQRRPRRASSPGLDKVEGGAEIKAAFEKGLADGPVARDGRLRQGHHQPARARPTSSSTPRCRR